MPAPDLSHRSIAELVSLDGQNALVTGGARGLGLAIARRFAEAGAAVILADIDEAAAQEAAAGLAAEFGREARGTHIDVRDSRSVAEAAACAVSGLGRLDIWVNNAGIYPVTPLLDLDDEEWNEVNAINLTGTFYGCREAARLMGDRGGVIINIESMAGHRGRAGCAHYAASKHGVSGITKSLAVELGGKGIRVLSIAPTLSETPGVQARRAQGAGASADMTGRLEAKVAASIPLGRTAQPDDVARVALFCASGLAAFVSGTTVFADGGHSAS